MFTELSPSEMHTFPKTTPKLTSHSAVADGSSFPLTQEPRG
jgi:hypothetical protein